jgi:dolichol-phosphate mannosyltransferase
MASATIAATIPDKISVVIPCYRVKGKVLDVVAKIGAGVSAIYVVDDACPERTADLVDQSVRDPRVRVIRREHNGGVGAATVAGMIAALADGADVVVKLDGDGQMDPALIGRLIAPILAGEADYTKGNRFFSPEFVKGMPFWRLFGNATLSFMSKLSSGYWTIFDPTNGFIAVHAAVLRALPLNDISPRFFFECDLLFRLNLVRANVVDVPMRARYADEHSNLRIHQVIGPFMGRLMLNFFKRIAYVYFVRDFTIGSLYLVFGVPLFGFGVVFGAYEWSHHIAMQMTASAGTVMLAALPLIIGFQLLLSFLAFDIATVPRTAVHRHLRDPG